MFRYTRILNPIQSYTESPLIYHTDSQANTNSGFYTHFSLHMYEAAHPHDCV